MSAYFSKEFLCKVGKRKVNTKSNNTGQRKADKNSNISAATDN